MDLSNKYQINWLFWEILFVKAKKLLLNIISVNKRKNLIYY